MFRRLNQIVFVVLIVVGAVAALPTLGVVDAATCDVAATATPPLVPSTASPSAPATLSMSLRAGDMTVADALRARVEDGLRRAGAEKIIDNPQHYPRATVTVSAVAGRWTPFWATLRTETTVVFDRKKPRAGAHDVEVTFVVYGSCRGLVAREGLQGAALDRLGEQVVDALTVPR